MKENRIDKLFKETLSNGNFDYKEAYWQDVNKRLTNQQAVTKTGLTIKTKVLIGFGIGIFVAGTAFFWNNLIPQQKETTSPQQEQKSSTPYTSFSKDTISKSIVKSPINVEEPLKDEPQIRNEKTESMNSARKSISDQINNVEVLDVKSNTEGQSNRTSFMPENSSTDGNKSIGDSKKTAPTTTTPQQENLQHVSNKTAIIDSAIVHLPQQEEQEQVVETKEESLHTTITTNESTGTKMAGVEDIILPHQKNKRWLISAGLDFSMLLSERRLFGDDHLSTLIEFRNKYEQAQRITSIGAQILFERNKWLFSTGINQTIFAENINYPSTLNVLTGVDNSQWQVQENWSYSVDSNWVITGIYQGNWQYDTTWAVTYDSTYMERWDSIFTEKENFAVTTNNGQHSISYLEIPFLVGRSFGDDRLRFELQAGGLAGILTGTTGSVYINRRLDDLNARAVHQAQFRDWQFSLLLRAGIRFDITPQIQTTFFPTIRYSLLNTLKGDAIRQRYLGYGINLGLLYRF